MLRPRRADWRRWLILIVLPALALIVLAARSTHLPTQPVPTPTILVAQAVPTSPTSPAQPTATPTLQATPTELVATPTATVALPSAATPTETIYHLGALQFVGAEDGWTLAYSFDVHPNTPLFLRTRDAGVTWQAAGSVPEGVRDIRFTSLNDGWAFGAGLYATHDGGASWTRAMTGTEISGMEITSGVWWLVATKCPSGQSDGCLFSSNDGGTTWQPTPVQPDLFNAWSAKIVAVGPQALFNFVYREPVSIDGRFSLQKTLDGGRSWQEIQLPPCFQNDGADLAGLTPDNLWLFCRNEPGAGSQQKWLYHSTNAGATWTLVAGANESMRSMPIMGYGAGLSISAPQQLWLSLIRGTLYGSNDGGVSWTVAIPFSDDDSSGAVIFTDQQYGWVVIGSALYRTTDGGRHWEWISQTWFPIP